MMSNAAPPGPKSLSIRSSMPMFSVFWPDRVESRGGDCRREGGVAWCRCADDRLTRRPDVVGQELRIDHGRHIELAGDRADHLLHVDDPFHALEVELARTP